MIRMKNGKQGGSVSFRSSRCRVMQADANRTEDNSSSSSPAVIGTAPLPLDAMQPPPPGISLPLLSLVHFYAKKKEGSKRVGTRRGTCNKALANNDPFVNATCSIVNTIYTYSRSIFYTGGFHRSKKSRIFFTPPKKTLRFLILFTALFLASLFCSFLRRRLSLIYFRLRNLFPS